MSRKAGHDKQHHVLLDVSQVNTASCLGLIKAMFCDNLLGEYPNLFLIAAANPYREEASQEDLVNRGSSKVMRDFFQAGHCPASLLLAFSIFW